MNLPRHRLQDQPHLAVTNEMMIGSAQTVITGAMADGLFESGKHMDALSVIQLNESDAVHQCLAPEEAVAVRALSIRLLEHYAERDKQYASSGIGRMFGRVAVLRGQYSEVGMSAQIILAHTESDSGASLEMSPSDTTTEHAAKLSRLSKLSP